MLAFYSLTTLSSNIIVDGGGCDLLRLDSSQLGLMCTLSKLL